MSDLENKGLVTPEILKEWEKISSDPSSVVEFHHYCQTSEPLLFLSFWEEWIRTILGPLIRELAPAVALNGGCVRTVEQLIERALIMGYFFGIRRYEASLESMDPSLGASEPEPEDQPDTGGFSPRDFLL